jgi:hypothetical protein
MYFGKRQTKPEVIKEVTAFATKFPERQYKPRLPMDVSCNDRSCTVRGTLDFRSVNLAERKVSKGVATFEYQLAIAGSSFKITLEGGDVLKREVSPLTSSPQSTDERGGISFARGGRQMGYSRRLKLQCPKQIVFFDDGWSNSRLA